mgnify:CR=1 FL=1
MEFCYDDDYNEAKQIKVIERRLDRARESRRNSKAESTQEYADRPYKFVQIQHEPDQALLVPRVSSERREYLPIGFINNDTVIADSAQAIYKPPVYLFALLSSKMHLSWVKLVSGRLENRFRYSSTISYNTFFSNLIVNSNLNLNELSMGMSEDYLSAIEYDATYLRIGSKIFGARS